MHDIWVVARKEFREQLQRRGEVMRYLWVAVIFGGGMPLVNVINGPRVLRMSSLIWLCYAGIFIASGATLGAFFTERQRATLETLFATPLSDLAVFAGKVLFSLFVSLAAVLAGVVIELMMINLFVLTLPELQSGFGAHGFGFPPINYFVLLVTLPTILIYTISLGTIISLRVDSIRTANLYNMLAVLPLLVPIAILGLFLPIGLNWPFVCALTGLLVVVDLIVMWLALRLFNREIAVLSIPT